MASPTRRSALSLHEAVAHTRTGDLWLFRGTSAADTAIRLATNAPVNHVGMAVALDDLPPLLWHAELGRSLPDMWTGKHHRGAQLNDLHDAVRRWHDHYEQQAWLRQLVADITPTMEDALLQTIARLNGTPFPRTSKLAGRWLRGRVRNGASLETAYCAELVAASYQAMGLIARPRPENFYDPGHFWSGDRLELAGGARLLAEVRVLVPGPDADADAPANANANAPASADADAGRSARQWLAGVRNRAGATAWGRAASRERP